MTRYSLEQAPEWLRNVASVSRNAAEKGLLAAAIKTVNHIVTVIIPATKPLPVDRGIYRAAWRAQKIVGGAEVINSSPHAAMIEHGVKNVKPGKKMIDALTEWVRRKGIGGTMKNGKLKKASVVEARAIAFAIATNMKKKGGFFDGGKGLKVFARAEKAIPRFIEEEVTREIKKAFS